MRTFHLLSEAIAQRLKRYFTALFQVAAGLIICLSACPSRGFAQAPPEYEAISVSLSLEGLGETEIPAVIKKDELYLSVTSLFSFLSVDYYISRNQDSISGFIYHPQDRYLIVEWKYTVSFQGKTYTLDPEDLISTEGMLYLRSKYFGEIFGLDCNFNPRTLSVLVTSRSELPIIRALRMEQTKSGNHKLDEKFVADRTIGREYRFFHCGAADWAIHHVQEVNGKGYSRVNLSFGGMLAGGEFKTLLTQTTGQPFSEKQQYYQWRFANNRNKIVRQVIAGKIAAQSISSIFQPVVGVQISNAPTYSRKAYGTFRYSGYVQPNWVVELYMNNALVDYVKSDAMGLISYDIPLAYGTTEVRTRYIGPWGEEHSFTRNFIIPFTMLPVRNFEYRLSAGVVEDGLGSIYAQGNMNYGLTDKITLGGGLEYLSSISKARSLPFLTATTRLAPNMLLSGEYVYGVRSKGILSYQLPKSLQFDLQYVRYEELQEAVRFNYTEERRASVSLPVRFRNGSAFSRLSLRRTSNESRNRSNIEWLISIASGGVGLNITSFAYLNSKSEPYTYSNFSASFRMRGGLAFVPKASYAYSENRFSSLSLGISRQFSPRLSVNAGFEKRFDFDQQNVRFGFKYDFSFARLSSSVNINKYDANIFTMAGGSLLYEKHLPHPRFSRNSSIGKGGIVFAPFLDINGNGKKEMFEPKVKGLMVRMKGHSGKIKTTAYRSAIEGLEPYQVYHISLDGSAFENLAWKISKPCLSIVVDPNSYKIVEVPVETLGEASGAVYLKDAGGKKGLGRINVMIYNEKSMLVATLLSEEDGYFSYLGLKPGRYTIRTDQSQLERLNMENAVPSLDFLIHSSRDGDVADKLDFILKPK